MPVKQRTRNVALTPHLDKYVERKIKSGRYQSASEVVRESLRLMEQQERERRETLTKMRVQIRSGYDQIKRGETVAADEVLNEIKAMSRLARKAAGQGK